jgi:hypothetical protein
MKWFKNINYVKVSNNSFSHILFLQILEIRHNTINFTDVKFVKLITTTNVFLNPIPYDVLYNFTEATNF